MKWKYRLSERLREKSRAAPQIQLILGDSIGRVLGRSTQLESLGRNSEACPCSFRYLRVSDYADHPGDAEGEVLEDVYLGGVREGGDDRRADVRLLSYPGLEGNLAEEVDVQLARDPPPSAGGEDIRLFAAVRAEEIAHVLDDAEDGHVEFPEHRERFRRDREGGLLWSGDDNDSAQWNSLSEGERRIACSRRKISYQVV